MLAERRFTLADQQAFARLSGDSNPMHLDALAARRTPAGAPVVHGIHAILWALDELASAGLPLASLAALNVQFRNFLPVGQPIGLRLTKQDGAAATAQLTVAGSPTTLLVLRFGRGKPGGETAFTDFLEIAVRGEEPDEPPFAGIASLSGWIQPASEPETFRTIVPRAVAALGADRVTGLALLSRLVGMVCPGLHSIFTGVDVTFADSPATRAGIGFKVDRLDERFRALWIAVAGTGMAGTVETRMRHPPVDMPSLDSLTPLVATAEFAGSLTLVIGGSRGLGALTARLLAAGGARVIISYARGKAEADAVATGINALRGDAACQVVQFDALADPGPQLAHLASEVTQLYYFATPQIFRQSAGVFAAETYDEFTRVYVHGFHAVCQHVLATGGSVSAFYPSSVSIDERPRGMTEYTMAKAAGEILCTDLARRLPRLRIVTSRLPRILTDQTATNQPVAFADPVAVMLPLIRQTQSAI